MVAVPNTFTDPGFVESMANWDGVSNNIMIDLRVHEFWFSLQCLGADFSKYWDIVRCPFMRIVEFIYIYMNLYSWTIVHY